MNVWDRCVAIAQAAFGVSSYYKRVFKKNEEDTNQVLYDLARFCGAVEMDVPVANADIAPLEMARKVGRLEVYQHINKMLRLTESEKNALVQRMYEYEKQQQNKELI
jgi:hypothetical protein